MTTKRNRKPQDLANDEFNVKKNLSKLKTGRGPKGNTTIVDGYQATENPSKPTNHIQENNLTDLMTYQEGVHAKYDNLKDNLNSKMDTFKTEFYNKVERFVEKEVFRWVIGGICTGIIIAGTLFYTLAYSELNEKVKLHDSEIQRIKMYDTLDMHRNNIRKDKN